MTRDYACETEKRVAFLRKVLADAGAKGFVYGNSGGKDSVLVGILCRKACANTLGVIMPCSSARNLGEDREDGLLVAAQYGIPTVEIDLTPVKQATMQGISAVQAVTDAASANIAPRLRMTALYAVAQSRGCLVAGTGNRSEGYVGYFTKWGDGAYDVNPIADLTVTEIYEFLRFLDAPREIISKEPSAGLFDGQTDEKELGFSYAVLDRYIESGEGPREAVERIQAMHQKSAHKRRLPLIYIGEESQ